jgi:cobalamin-dependent methionine synthase I
MEQPKDPEYPRVPAIAPAPEVTPLFYGMSQLLSWPAQMLLDSIDRSQVKQDCRVPDDVDFEAALAEECSRLVHDDILHAHGLYGFFAARMSSLGILDISDLSDPDTTLCSLMFPHPENGKRSVIDFFRPEGDVVAFQAVTLGRSIEDLCRRCLDNPDTAQRGRRLDGLARLLTANLADRVTREIRRALGIPSACGKRYAFGASGMPGLSGIAALWDLLGFEERLNITISSQAALSPAYSSAGLFAHHPQAEEF